MKKVTLEIPDEIYEQAKELAKIKNISVKELFVNICSRKPFQIVSGKGMGKTNYSVQIQDVFPVTQSKLVSNLTAVSDLPHHLDDVWINIDRFNLENKLAKIGLMALIDESVGIKDEVLHSQNATENLSDAKVLELVNLKLPEDQQETLHELLEKNNEGELTNLERKYLDDLMEVYNDALLTKAKAMRIAVERGLMKPLSS